MKLSRLALAAATLASAALVTLPAMALDEAQLKELGGKAGSWLDGSKTDSASDFNVGGSSMHVEVVIASKDAKDRDLRVLSIDGANGQHSCHGLVKDGDNWHAPDGGYKVSC